MRPEPAAANPDTLRAIVESSGDALYSADLKGRISSWNRGAQALYGWSARRIVGKPLTTIWPPGSDAAVRRILREAARGRPYRNARDIRAHRDGRELHVSAGIFPLRGPSGKVVGVSIVSRDTSAEAVLERLERETHRLRESERLQRDFVANVSHELRTPVAAIQGFAETLLSGALDEPGTSRQFVRIIQKHAARLARLIEDLLHLSVLEAGRRRPRKKLEALEPLVRRFLGELTPLLKRKELTLRLRLDRSLRARVDSDQLEQVLQNLLTNAIRFSPRGGRITIMAHRLGSQAAVTVADQGRGIPAHDLPTIFQRFNRSQKRKPGEGGTGLGLSIAKEIVEAHGGRIWAESTEGRGAAFHFTVPLRG